MPRTLLFCVSLLCLSFHAFSQLQQTAPPDTGIVVKDDKVFSKAEIDAAFPGGADGWRNYLQKNLRANVPVKKKAPEGDYTVIVRFVVAKDGSISDIVAETNHGYGMEQELMRILRKGPKWTPASQDGRFVKAYRRQPITFVVSRR